MVHPSLFLPLAVYAAFIGSPDRPRSSRRPAAATGRRRAVAVAAVRGVEPGSRGLGRLLTTPGNIQVITDIDDTVKSSGGVALAGIPLGGVDSTVSRGRFYPGVFQFGLELSCHPAGIGRRVVPQDMAILTARAEEFKWALEIKQSSKLCRRFRAAGRSRGWAEWGVGPVLYGSVAEWICQERKGWRKFENFKLLRSDARSSTRYVFVGDNGSSEKVSTPGSADHAFRRRVRVRCGRALLFERGTHQRPTEATADAAACAPASQDIEAAHMMISAFPSELRAVFIHAVHETERPAPLPADYSQGGVPIVFFRTYAAAAQKAARLGLIGGEALLRVCEAAEEDAAGDRENFAAGSANARLLQDELQLARAAAPRPAGIVRRARGWLGIGLGGSAD